MKDKEIHNQTRKLDISSPKFLIRVAQEILGRAATASSLGQEKNQINQARRLLNSALRALQAGPNLLALDSQWQSKFGANSQADLMKKISRGEIPPSTELNDYLKRRTLLRLTIDNPNYWGYMEAKKRWLGGKKTNIAVEKTSK